MTKEDLNNYKVPDKRTDFTIRDLMIGKVAVFFANDRGMAGEFRDWCRNTFSGITKVNIPTPDRKEGLFAYLDKGIKTDRVKLNFTTDTLGLPDKVKFILGSPMLELNNLACDPSDIICSLYEPITAEAAKDIIRRSKKKEEADTVLALSLRNEERKGKCNLQDLFMGRVAIRLITNQLTFLAVELFQKAFPHEKVSSAECVSTDDLFIYRNPITGKIGVTHSVDDVVRAGVLYLVNYYDIAKRLYEILRKSEDDYFMGSNIKTYREEELLPSGDVTRAITFKEWIGEDD